MSGIVDSQLRISQAIEQGDASQVQILWAIATKDVAQAESLRRQVAIQEMVTKLRDKAAAGSLSIDDLQPPAAPPVLICRSTRDWLPPGLSMAGQLPGGSRSMPNAVPGQATTRVDLPTARSCHLEPKTSGARQSAGNGTVMVGTGGVGHLQQSMASVGSDGAPAGNGPFRSASSEPPTLAGVLLVNPEITQTPVSFASASKSNACPARPCISPRGPIDVEFARGRQLEHNDMAWPPARTTSRSDRRAGNSTGRRLKSS